MPRQVAQAACAGHRTIKCNNWQFRKQQSWRVHVQQLIELMGKTQSGCVAYFPIGLVPRLWTSHTGCCLAGKAHLAAQPHPQGR